MSGCPLPRDPSAPAPGLAGVGNRALAAIVLIWLLVALAAALLPASVVAAPAPQPALTLQVHKLVAAVPGGPPVRGPAEAARAGDTLEYSAVYRNATADPQRQVQVTVPVPATGVEYLPGSGLPAPTLASTDGKRYAPLPLMRTETTPDGRKVERPVPAADYRYLRWSLGDVPAGASVGVSARVRLLGPAER